MDDLTLEIERAQDQVCIDFWERKIDRQTAKNRLVALGVDPEICEEGLTETERRRAAGLPMVPSMEELAENRI